VATEHADERDALIAQRAPNGRHSAVRRPRVYQEPPGGRDPTPDPGGPAGWEPEPHAGGPVSCNACYGARSTTVNRCPHREQKLDVCWARG